MAAYQPLGPCPSCQRHIRVAESTCPFCKAEISISARPGVEVPRRLSRKAAMVFAAGALALTGCSSSDGEPAKDAGGDTADTGMSAMYGGPPDAGGDVSDTGMSTLYGGPPVDSGAVDSADTGIAAAYGAPPSDSGAVDDTGGGGAKYGAPPPP